MLSHKFVTVLLPLASMCLVVASVDMNEKVASYYWFKEQRSSGSKQPVEKNWFTTLAGFSHSGLYVTTESGNGYVVEKLNDEGTQVKKWNPAGRIVDETGRTYQPKYSTTLQDLVDVGGGKYNAALDNCRDAVKQMMMRLGGSQGDYTYFG